MAFRQHDEREPSRFLPPPVQSAPVHYRELQSWDKKPSNCRYAQPPLEHSRSWHELPETYNGFEMPYPIQAEYLYERSIPIVEYNHEHMADFAFRGNGFSSNGPETAYNPTFISNRMDAAIPYPQEIHTERPSSVQDYLDEFTRPKKRRRSNTSNMQAPMVPPDAMILSDNPYLTMTIPKTHFSNSEFWGAQALCETTYFCFHPMPEY